MKLTESEFKELARKVDNSGRWGADDRLGCLNLITPEKRLAALKLIQTGEAIDCSEPWNVELGRGEVGTRPRIAPEANEVSPGLLGGQEHLEMYLHGKASPTAIKALGHVYYEGTTYNGMRPGQLDENGFPVDATYPGPLSIITRGVMIDLPLARGTEFLAAEEPGTVADIEKALSTAGLTLEPGDALFLRTGLPLSGIIAGPGAAVPGMDIDAAEWIHAADLGLIVTDGGVDVHPTQVENVFIPWHVLTLNRMGLRTVFHADLEALAKHCSETGRYEFALVTSLLPIPHAMASPVNPLAMF